MRLQLVSDIDSRDGSSNKDERLTNALAEKDGKAVYACIRPGLNQVATESGVGNGLTCFGGTLISVYGTVLGYGDNPAAIQSVTSGEYDFAVMP
jgi:hypothetical protein